MVTEDDKRRLFGELVLEIDAWKAAAAKAVEARVDIEDGFFIPTSEILELIAMVG